MNKKQWGDFVNQILDTGEERVIEPVAKKIEKQKNVLPINAILIFFAISIIILGICIVVGTKYSKDGINREVEASIKPQISFERNDENNTVMISVTNLVEIKEISYRWNDEEEIMIDGKSRKSIIEEIDLVNGENTLKVTATGINGQTVNLEKKFTYTNNVPNIELEAVANGVKIIATCNEEIDYIEYSWDDGEKQKVEVAKEEYEGIINTPKGKHTLKIEVVTINGGKGNEERVVVGDTEPTVNIESKLINGKATFVIHIEDDEEINTVEIVHNSGEKQTIEVNDKTYDKEITMTEGELNTLIVRATNLNGLTDTKGVKFNNQ